jgi:hypothetical protein
MGIEVTQPTTDNPTTAAVPAAATEVPQGDAVLGAAFPGGDALIDYGQRLTEALRAKGQELARQPAKRRALWPVAVATLAGVVAARDVLFSSAGPARAAAAFTPRAGGLTPVRSDNALSGSPAADAPRVSQLRAWLDEPVSPLERNIFTFNPPAALNGPDSQGVEAKSAAESADSNLRREGSGPPPTSVVSGRDAASAASGSSKVQARQIRLQSTLMGGANPAALVNGQMVREGDVVAAGSGGSRTAYRVLKIEARRIILEREGIRSEIPLE